MKRTDGLGWREGLRVRVHDMEILCLSLPSLLLVPAIIMYTLFLEVRGEESSADQERKGEAAAR